MGNSYHVYIGPFIRTNADTWSLRDELSEATGERIFGVTPSDDGANVVCWIPNIKGVGTSFEPKCEGAFQEVYSENVEKELIAFEKQFEKEIAFIRSKVPPEHFRVCWGYFTHVM